MGTIRPERKYAGTIQRIFRNLSSWPEACVGTHCALSMSNPQRRPAASPTYGRIGPSLRPRKDQATDINVAISIHIGRKFILVGILYSCGEQEHEAGEWRSGRTRPHERELYCMSIMLNRNKVPRETISRTGFIVREHRLISSGMVGWEGEQKRPEVHHHHASKLVLKSHRAYWSLALERLSAEQ